MNLKVVLYVYLVALLCRVLLAALLMVVLNPNNDLQDYGPAIIPVQVLVFKIPIFLFFFILFKMKKIEILLDFGNNMEEEVTTRDSIIQTG